MRGAAVAELLVAPQEAAKRLFCLGRERNVSSLGCNQRHWTARGGSEQIILLLWEARVAHEMITNLWRLPVFNRYTRYPKLGTGQWRARLG